MGTKEIATRQIIAESVLPLRTLSDTLITPSPLPVGIRQLIAEPVQIPKIIGSGLSGLCASSSAISSWLVSRSPRGHGQTHRYAARQPGAKHGSCTASAAWLSRTSWPIKRVNNRLLWRPRHTRSHGCKDTSAERAKYVQPSSCVMDSRASATSRPTAVSTIRLSRNVRMGVVSSVMERNLGLAFADRSSPRHHAA